MPAEFLDLDSFTLKLLPLMRFKIVDPTATAIGKRPRVVPLDWELESQGCTTDSRRANYAETVPWFQKYRHAHFATKDFLHFEESSDWQFDNGSKADACRYVSAREPQRCDSHKP